MNYRGDYKNFYIELSQKDKTLYFRDYDYYRCGILSVDSISCRRIGLSNNFDGIGNAYGSDIKICNNINFESNISYYGNTSDPVGRANPSYIVFTPTYCFREYYIVSDSEYNNYLTISMNNFNGVIANNNLLNKIYMKIGYYTHSQFPSEFNSTKWENSATSMNKYLAIRQYDARTYPLTSLDYNPENVKKIKTLFSDVNYKRFNSNPIILIHPLFEIYSNTSYRYQEAVMPYNKSKNSYLLPDLCIGELSEIDSYVDSLTDLRRLSNTGQTGMTSYLYWSYNDKSFTINRTVSRFNCSSIITNIGFNNTRLYNDPPMTDAHVIFEYPNEIRANYVLYSMLVLKNMNVRMYNADLLLDDNAIQFTALNDFKRAATLSLIQNETQYYPAFRVQFAMYSTNFKTTISKRLNTSGLISTAAGYMNNITESKENLYMILQGSTYSTLSSIFVWDDKNLSDLCIPVPSVYRHVILGTNIACSDFIKTVHTRIPANVAISTNYLGLPTKSSVSFNFGSADLTCSLGTTYENACFAIGAGIQYGLNWSRQVQLTSTTSDIKDKFNIHDLSTKDCKNIIDNIHPVEYQYTINHPEKVRFGIIAQELEDVMIKNGLDPRLYELLQLHDRINLDDMECNNIMHREYGINYQEFISILIKYVQDLNKRIIELESRL